MKVAGLSSIGYILALVGGILVIVFSLLSILGSPFLAFFSPSYALGALTSGLLGLIIGVICVIGSKFVSHIGWAIVLIILGVYAGGIGGVLVVLGALIGLLARLIRE